MHIHLDTVGGISGNMFIGALLDVYPQWSEQLPQQLSLAGFDELVTLQSEAKNDGVISGTFFNVLNRQSHDKNPNAHHHHRPYKLIHETISASALENNVKQHALGIFKVLAEAESSVHGMPIDEVSFHEVGAWDSIADIVCAAYLIECLHQIDRNNECTWSVSALPLGNGLVQTAHGAIPIPAPAVSLLLQGFNFYRDAIEGERITPTGAAILKYLQPQQIHLDAQANLSLQHSGYGFGSKVFPGISNTLRVLVFNQEILDNKTWRDERVLQINFEVDDQSAEDIAIAIDVLRETEGVLDVIQYPVFAKKGRIATSIQLLGHADCDTALTALCFQQFNTLGLRKQFVQRAVLNRENIVVKRAEGDLHIKVAHRPEGEVTAKLAADNVAERQSSQQSREKLRYEEQEKAIKQRQTNKLQSDPQQNQDN